MDTLASATVKSSSRDPRRGVVRVVMLPGHRMNLQWATRVNSGSLVVWKDIPLVPGTIESIRPLPSGGRMAELRFQDNNRKSLFLWLQEPDTGADQSLWESLSDLTSNLEGLEEDEEDEEEVDESTDAAALLAGAAAGGSGMEVDSAGVQSGQRAPYPGRRPCQHPREHRDAATACTAGNRRSDCRVRPVLPHPCRGTKRSLAAMLSGMAGQQQPEVKLPSLAEVLTPQVVVPLLQQEGVRNRLAELVQYLPQEHQAAAAQEPGSASVETWRSAPLLNHLRTLSAALQSGQLDYSQFGLQPLGYSAADFLQSIQDKAEEEKKDKK